MYKDKDKIKETEDYTLWKAKFSHSRLVLKEKNRTVDVRNMLFAELSGIGKTYAYRDDDFALYLMMEEQNEYVDEFFRDKDGKQQLLEFLD